MTTDKRAVPIPSQFQREQLAHPSPRWWARVPHHEPKTRSFISRQLTNSLAVQFSQTIPTSINHGICHTNSRAMEPISPQHSWRRKCCARVVRSFRWTSHTYIHTDIHTYIRTHSHISSLFIGTERVPRTGQGSCNVSLGTVPSVLSPCTY